MNSRIAKRITCWLILACLVPTVFGCQSAVVRPAGRAAHHATDRAVDRQAAAGIDATKATTLPDRQGELSGSLPDASLMYRDKRYEAADYPEAHIDRLRDGIVRELVDTGERIPQESSYGLPGDPIYVRRGRTPDQEIWILKQEPPVFDADRGVWHRTDTETLPIRLVPAR